MGTMIEVSCSSCSYREMASTGAGMLGIAYEVMVCRDCERVRSVAVEKSLGVPLGQKEQIDLNRCPECGGTNLDALAISEDVEYRPSKTTHRCPVCKSGILVVEGVGSWH
jgi:hypothetical protein